MLLCNYIVSGIGFFLGRPLFLTVAPPTSDFVVVLSKVSDFLGLPRCLLVGMALTLGSEVASDAKLLATSSYNQEFLL